MLPLKKKNEAQFLRSRCILCFSVVEWPPTVSSANGRRDGLALLSPPRDGAEAGTGSPPRFPPTHRREQGSYPLHDNHRRHLSLPVTAPVEVTSTLGKPSPTTSVSPGLSRVGELLFQEVLSHSWLQCWSPQSARNPPGLQQHDHL